MLATYIEGLEFKKLRALAWLIVTAPTLRWEVKSAESPKVTGQLVIASSREQGRPCGKQGGKK